MAKKLYFRHGTMGCGKSTNLLQVAHNYESVGQEVFVMKPRFDSRNGHLIQSRLGVDRCVNFQVDKDDNIFEVVKQHQDRSKKPYACILIDEVNFITKEQARQLWQVATELDVPVIAYGLRVDYMGEGFDASKELLVLAHEIEELKTVDASGKKCTMHLRSIGGRYVFEGDSLIIGDITGEERYESCTSKKWLEEKKKYDNEKIEDQIDCRGGLCSVNLAFP